MQLLLKDVTPTVLSALSANPGFTLCFVGHSLGAGVAALACFLVREGLYEGAQLASAAQGATATCFASPPVLTMDAAISCSSYIRSGGRDSVSSFSPIHVRWTAGPWPF